MKWSIKSNQVIFQGSLNEDINLSALKKETSNSPTELQMDFSNVIYANSTGISCWLKFLQDFSGSFEYINAPYWLVNYFNLIPELIAGRHKVINIQVPYYAQNSKKDILVSFEIGKEIPVLDSYKEFELSTVEKDGDTYIPDIVPEIYFGFISTSKSLY